MSHDLPCSHGSTKRACPFCRAETLSKPSPDTGGTMASLDFLEEWWGSLPSLPSGIEDDPLYMEKEVYPLNGLR